MKYHFYGIIWEESDLERLYKKLGADKWIKDKYHPKDVIDSYFYFLSPQEKAKNFNSYSKYESFVYDPATPELAKKAYERIQPKTEIHKFLVKETPEKEEKIEQTNEEKEMFEKKTVPVKNDSQVKVEMNVFNTLQNSLTAALDNIANCKKEELEINLKRGHGLVEVANAMIQAVNSQVNCIKLADSLKNTSLPATLIEDKS